MPTPQEILTDPNFQNLSTGDQLTVMRKADPNFAALPATEQGTVIAKSRQRFLGTDKIGQQPDGKVGFFGRLGGDLKGLAQTAMGLSITADPATRAEAVKSIVMPNVVEFQKAKDKNLSPVERFGHGLAAALPGVGPMAARTGEDIGTGDYGAATADMLELTGPKLAKEFGAGFKEGWDAAGPKPRTPAWKSIPSPATPVPAPVEPIKGSLPSGRVPGGQSDVQTLSTAQKLPLWHMVRDQIVEPPKEVSPIPAKRTLSGRTPGGPQNQVQPTSRVPIWKLSSPETPVPATETPSVQSGPVIPAQSAAELLKTAGIGVDAVQKATPEQWKLIEQHVGATVDRNAVMDQMRLSESLADYRKRVSRSHAKFNAAGQRQ